MTIWRREKLHQNDFASHGLNNLLKKPTIRLFPTVYADSFSVKSGEQRPIWNADGTYDPMATDELLWFQYQEAGI